MLRKVVFLVFLFGFAASASAQDTWSVMNGDGGRDIGAGVCPFESPSGHFTCLLLSCSSRSDPLQWRLAVAGGWFGDAPDVAISVDGGPRQVLSLEETPFASYLVYATDYVPERDAELVQALQKGRSGLLTVPQPGGDDRTLQMSLRGSSRALKHALQTCPVAKPMIADPVAMVLAEIEATCARLGGTVTVNDGFARHEDLDADGTPDLILNYGAASCDKALSLYCGSAGCLRDIYRAVGPDGYVQVMADNLHGIQALDGGGVVMFMHGSACGKAGAAPCQKTFHWQGNRLVHDG